MSVAQATRQVVSADFALAVGAGVAGFLFSEMATAAMREHVVDLPSGGDAVYGIVTAVALVAVPVVPNQYARPAAFGAAASGVLTTLEEFGLVNRLKTVSTA